MRPRCGLPLVDGMVQKGFIAANAPGEAPLRRAKATSQSDRKVGRKSFCNLCLGAYFDAMTLGVKPPVSTFPFFSNKKLAMTPMGG